MADELQPATGMLPDLRCFVLVVGNARSGSTPLLLLGNPEAELHRIGDFLGLPRDPDHVAAVRAMLFERPRRTAENLDWDQADVADILARMSNFRSLARYLGEAPVAASPPPTRLD
jgi:hypothetical protein